MSDIDAAFKKFQLELDEEMLALEQGQLSLFIRKIALDALRGVVLKTPVDTGRARANWQVTFDAAAQDRLDTVDQSGQNTINKGTAKILQMDASSPPNVFITNNLDYIEFLEQGTSTQAPQGMVEITLQELRTMFN